GGVGEAEPLEELGAPAPHLGAAEPVQRPLEDEVLAARRLVRRAVALADDADRAAHALGRREHGRARHLPAARAWPRERGQDLEAGRLSRTVRPEQAEDRAARDAEGEPVQGQHLSVALPYIACEDRCFHPVPSWAKISRRPYLLPIKRYDCQE